MSEIDYFAMDEPSPYRKISSIFIQTDTAKKFFARMKRLITGGSEENNCKFVLLIGPSGSGKTQLLKQWRRLYLERYPGKRVVISEVPVGCKLAGLEATLLKDLGDPDPSYGGPAQRLQRLEELGKACDVLMLDETQRVVDETTRRVKKDVANWITNLLNLRICPMVFVGEDDATLPFDGVIYAERRSLGQVDAEPFVWATQREEFRAFLMLLEKELAMPGKSRLSNVGTALRIHSFSLGRIGLIAQLVDEARANAHEHGRGAITHDDLARAVDLLRIGQKRALPNPFREPKPSSGDPPPPQVRDLELEVQVEGHGTGRKASASKGKPGRKVA